MAGAIGLAAVLFASTNIDDIFVLIAFFADPRLRVSQIVIGQYLGIFCLLLISVAASLVSLVLPPDYLGLLGILPVFIGLKKLTGLWREDEQDQATPGTQSGAVLTVTAVTMANGGDNIGVYTPVFATHFGPEIIVIAGVFAVMTAAWLAAAHLLVNHPQLGAPIRRYVRKVVPFVLIGLGLLILHEAGSFHLLSVGRAALP